ncbi:MAG: hypothetical protein ACYC6A_10800 [Armatimonadota bacterium]
MRTLPFLMSLVIVVGLLAGCHDAPSETGITVRVVNQLTGGPVAGTDVFLQGSGITTRFTTSASGTVFIPDVPVGGPYSLLLVTPAGYAPVLAGPIAFSGANLTVISEVLTYAQLLATFGVARPTDNTATVVAFGYERLDGDSPTREVQLTVDTMTDTGNPAVVTGIPVPPPGHNITVTDTATGRAVLFPGQQLVPNSVLVVQAAFEGVD